MIRLRRGVMKTCAVAVLPYGLLLARGMLSSTSVSFCTISGTGACRLCMICGTAPPLCWSSARKMCSVSTWVCL